MSLHFVSTSVLTSEDGIQFSKEIQLETEEAKRLRKDQERQANKPLFMQLAERQDEKQLEYDKITKLIFAPPKGLDEDEYEFLNEVETNKNQNEQYNRQKENEEIEKFKQLTKVSNHNAKEKISNSSKVNNTNNTAISEGRPNSIAHMPILPIITARKRKADVIITNSSSSTSTNTKNDKNIGNKNSTTTTTTTTNTLPSSTKNSTTTLTAATSTVSTVTKALAVPVKSNENALSLLGSYSDDDDGDNES